MSKTIVFCADGTYNGPVDDVDGEEAAATNVFKLFRALQGDLAEGTAPTAVEQEKELADESGTLVQVAKYLHGVGNAENRINRMFSGAVGSGVIKRIVRGYTFLSRHYQAGDALVIVGFSRGAYTARALAGMVVSQGLLDPVSFHDAAGRYDQEKAYEMGGKVWYRYRDGADGGRHPLLLDTRNKLANLMRKLPRFLKREEGEPEPTMVAVDQVKAVAVWDTVGALGIPIYFEGSRYDPFRFTNTALSSQVEFGFHAVSLDEQRGDFQPTLWDERENVKQVLFAGVHSDVGGGYPQAESGLSDLALEWMVEQLRGVGVRLSDPIVSCKPRFDGPDHREQWFGQKMAPRVFPTKGITVHPSVQQRIDGVVVGRSGVAYAPGNLP